MRSLLKELEDNLTTLLLEQKQAYDDYTKHPTGEAYSKILMMKKQVARAKAEVAKNK